MNSKTQRLRVPGPAGEIECALDVPAEGTPRGLAVLCHPHPQHGGTMDNKVVQTLARACVQMGWRSVRFNFRGVGASAGAWDEGRGEIEDALAVVAAMRQGDEPLLLGGFSFGGFVASHVAQRVQPAPQRLVLVGPATSRFDVATVPADTLVVHGEQDEVVPLSATLDWARPQSLPVVVVPGGGHFFHGQLPLLKSIVLRHLAH
ncbi:alpha/beta fold hydrolase [uncultured Azohydromonas sp.]|uniref:alpha/beta hydrolase n=1 Tax=uncultured Azohydromonas sp. TaxID=487342 RepID=UPI0026073A93|nr:alpha/beta fold hydrolase [uncultured Azohydromonas sp.]